MQLLSIYAAHAVGTATEPIETVVTLITCQSQESWSETSFTGHKYESFSISVAWKVDKKTLAYGAQL